MTAATFDRRIVGDTLLEFLREVQERVPCHLGGGAALAGAHLSHRRTRDLDVFVHDRALHRELVGIAPDAAARCGAVLSWVRDGGTFVRATLDVPGEGSIALDLVHEALRDLSPPQRVEGVWLESLLDLRASKVTCLLSRSEPRDLVDLLFLERAGHRIEDDLPWALEKDAGLDPAILAWLLETFPVAPLPDMIEPLTSEALRAFRDDLRDRLRALALPPSGP